MCRLLAAVALALLCSGGASTQDAGCLQVVHPPANYVLAPDEQESLELVLQVNCPGAARARLLQLYSATGNGTAGNMLWQVPLDADADEMFQVAWQMLAGDASPLTAYEHWHCSGWRQWKLVVHRENGEREDALVRVRASLLEEALERIEAAAMERGEAPSFVQVGAMDGIGHDHLFHFIAKGTWRGLLVEPLKDFFRRLVEHYSPAAGGGNEKLQFANMCVAEAAGKRIMRRLASGAMDAELVKTLGYDGSSSLLSDSQGLPPGMALSFASLPPDTQQQVLAGLVEEEVECAPLHDILSTHGLCSSAAATSAPCSPFDVFAVDTEGYDLKILQQLFGEAPPEGRRHGLQPAVIFLEVGLLSAADQARAAALVEARGYVARRCGYGMEMLATLAPLGTRTRGSNSG